MPGGIGGTPAGNPDDVLDSSALGSVVSIFTLVASLADEAVSSGDFIVGNAGGPTAGTMGMVGREDKLGRDAEVWEAMASAASVRPTGRDAEDDDEGARDGDVVEIPAKPARLPERGRSDRPLRPLVPDITEAGVPSAWPAGGPGADSRDFGRLMAVEGGGESSDGASPRAAPASGVSPMDERVRLSPSLMFRARERRGQGP
mmetsp:Transcript_1280/g.2435  ORF Transcript_1280/g.2435 Transcript_1280/m.2435 type:complete len:202 (+) Transcript_1280:945-1550(+)|eukprot:CAMPEP_0167785554 /NCGR_PEP_ID=MMETSP0111_2-20121227/8296_1 /TAXON_ID=91324 /ORGANISM="Lotharella globosa, Strain CCCM811" /LENGTH=201 /DNA_ID=CAMNT_0007676827 /DNA_START=993 /DNA_END=1598 /DNA_ORIENTATION=-